MTRKIEDWPQFDENGPVMSMKEVCEALGLAASTVRVLATRKKNPALQVAPKHRWRSGKSMEIIAESVEYYKANRLRDARWNDDPES
jgi:hypothetical protein